MTTTEQRELEPTLAAGTSRAWMNPLYFGSAARPLFGLYGPPRTRVDREEGIILCSPIGHEYIRTHWALRLLADQLLQEGYHVLRFDYSCQGDSWGAFEEATVEQWVADVKTAAEELADTSGVQKISAIGLRLGATLALEAARQGALHRLLLWDPVLDGRSYVGQLRTMQQRMRTIWAHAPMPTPGAEFEDLLGYRYSADLIRQIDGLVPKMNTLPKGVRVDVIASKDHEDWNDVTRFGEPVLLTETRRVIAALLGEKAP